MTNHSPLPGFRNSVPLGFPLISQAAVLLGEFLLASPIPNGPAADQPPALFPFPVTLAPRGIWPHGLPYHFNAPQVTSPPQPLSRNLLCPPAY